MAKLLKTKSRGKILIASREKRMGTFRRATIRMLADFAIEMMKARRQCIEKIGGNVLKEYKISNRILYTQ